MFGLQSPPVSDKHRAPPLPTLLNEIERKKAEIMSLNERVTRLRQELDVENDSIELDRVVTGNDARRNYELTVKVRVYNEKSGWLNHIWLR
jgi:hypothetical protein